MPLSCVVVTKRWPGGPAAAGGYSPSLEPPGAAQLARSWKVPRLSSIKGWTFSFTGLGWWNSPTYTCFNLIPDVGLNPSGKRPFDYDRGGPWALTCRLSPKQPSFFARKHISWFICLPLCLLIHCHWKSAVLSSPGLAFCHQTGRQHRFAGAAGEGGGSWSAVGCWVGAQKSLWPPLAAWGRLATAAFSCPVSGRTPDTCCPGGMSLRAEQDSTAGARSSTAEREPRW